MKICILWPTNIKKFSILIGKSIEEIISTTHKIRKILAENNHQAVMVFNYTEMLKLLGDAYKHNRGKFEMLYTENDYD